MQPELVANPRVDLILTSMPSFEERSLEMKIVAPVTTLLAL